MFSLYKILSWKMREFNEDSLLKQIVSFNVQFKTRIPTLFYPKYNEATLWLWSKIKLQEETVVTRTLSYWNQMTVIIICCNTQTENNPENETRISVIVFISSFLIKPTNNLQCWAMRPVDQNCINIFVPKIVPIMVILRCFGSHPP